MNSLLRLICLTFLVLIETLSFSYFRDCIPMSILTWTFFLSGLGIGILSLLKGNDIINVANNKYNRVKSDIILVFTTALSCYVIYMSVISIQGCTLGKWADMMLFIQTQCTLCLNGEYPYKVVPELWNGAATYLPMYWIPFIPLRALHIDIRYMLIPFYLGSLWFIISLLCNSLKSSFIFMVVSLVSLTLLVNFCMARDFYFMAWTEEPLAIFYYVFLGWALLKQNAILLGFAIAFCVLSRYLLIAWIPCFLIFTYIFENKKLALQTTLYCLSFVGIVFVIPFFIRDPSFFLQIPSQYAKVIGAHWPNYYDSFVNHFGIIKFYKVNQHSLAHILSVTFGLVTPVITFVILAIIKLRKIPFNQQTVGIGSLKILMCVFYFFIEIPEDYILYVPLFFSYVILFHAFRQSYYRDEVIVSTQP